MVRRTFVAIALAASTAHAQELFAPESRPAPAQLVHAALAGDHAVADRAMEHHGAAHEWSFAINVRQGECYEVIGVAQGPSRVRVEVRARRARIGDPVSIATGDGGVARTRFCAELPGRVYGLAVDAEGPTRWAVAVHPAPAEPPPTDPGASARERLAASLANATTEHTSAAPASSAPAAAPAQNYPIGGSDNDYVAAQIRGAVQGRAVHAFVAADRVPLRENETRTVDLALTGGHCVTIVAAGVPSVADFDLQLFDPSGDRVAQDATHRGTESVSYCPTYSGTYRFSVRAFAGAGLTGVQAFEVR